MNTVEGGLGKYFEEFKTADRLIDKLLIPAIENKLSPQENVEEESLVTMFLSYVKQCKSKDGELKRQKIYNNFEGKLKKLEPHAEKMWQHMDMINKSVSELFGFRNALTFTIEDLKTKENNAKEEVVKIKQNIRRIEWEKESEKFYKQQKAYMVAQETHQLCTETKEAFEKSHTDANLELLALECANHFAKKQKAEHEKKAIDEQIQRREHEESNSDAIKNLKYSIYSQITKELPKKEDEQARIKTKQLELAETQTQMQTHYNQAKKQLEKETSEYAKLQGQKNSANKEVENLVGDLQIGLMRKLDGEYSQEELDLAQTEKQTDLETIKKTEEKEQEKLELLEQEIERFPQEIANMDMECVEIQRDLELAVSQLNTYHDLEEQIKEIFYQYNLNFDKRFDVGIKNYFISEKNTLSTKRITILDEIELAEEMIQASKKGNVHIPRAIVRHLEENEPNYKTCEKYLFDLVKSEKISKEFMLETLEKYPVLAYGIIMEDKEKERLLQEERAEWMPSMVPIFTHMEMEHFLENKGDAYNAIAFYSRAYFQDNENYLENVQKKKRELKAQSELIEKQLQSLEKQIKVISQFTYAQSWKAEQKEIISELEKKLSSVKEKMEQSKQLKLAKQHEKAELKNSMQELAKELLKMQRFMEKFKEMLRRIQEENEINTKCYEQKNVVDSWKKTEKKLAEELEQMKVHLEQCETDMTIVEADIKKLKLAMQSIGEVENGTLMEGDWQEFLTQYKTIVETQDKEIGELRAKLQEKVERIEECQMELQKRNIPLERYENLAYHVDLENQARKKEAELRINLKEALKIWTDSLEERGKAGGLMESIEKEIEENYGEPLSLSQIGGNFEERIKVAHQQKNTAESYEMDCREKMNQMDRILGNCSDFMMSYTPPEKIAYVEIEEDYKKQLSLMKDLLASECKELELEREKSNGIITDIKNELATEDELIATSIMSIQNHMKTNGKGDSYFTLCEYIGACINNVKLMISKIDTDLLEIENAKSDLVHQCTLQGQRIHQGLNQMSTSSKILVYHGRAKQCMIKFKMPVEVDAKNAHTSIENEIEKGMLEIGEKIDANASEQEIQKFARGIVDSKNLFRKYIEQETVPMEAYKIDSNPVNGGYREWKKMQTDSSGAERFVVYFAIILSLMKYNRSAIGEDSGKHLHSSLILDNPFGSTSSKHILVPMFEISKDFGVQMICLSDINKSDVTSCFDIVIKAIIKPLALSGKEILTHEGNEKIEHGFYRKEQLRMQDVF